MGFLVPIAFVAGAVLLVAVVITYLLKPSRPSRRVSSTLLWMAAYHELQARRPWRRVPPSVLLLLQILALAAIVLALARPYVLSAEATGPDAIVLLDVSASMQATDIAPSRFEAARARVATLIARLEPDQTLGLISLGAEPRLVAPRTSDRDVLFRALGGLQPSTQTANLAAGLSLAASLADGRPETVVFVVSDGAIDRTQVPAGLPFVVRNISVGAPADNLAIAAFGTRTFDGRLAALARVANYGAQRRTATLDLRIDGTRFDARFLAIEPGAAADAQWDELPSTARVLEARLVETDALALDDTAWAVVGGDRPTRILLVSEANIFLERALALRPSTQVVRADPATYAPSEPFDLVVFDGYLPPVLPEAGSLFLVHPPPGASIVRAREDVVISRISAAQQDHPLLADVPLGGVHVSRSRRLEVPVWADAIVESPETPLLLVGDTGGQRVAVLGFDVHQSDLPLQPAFPILMQHLLDWLVPPGSVATPVIRLGDAATIVPLPEAQSVDVEVPDGRRVRLAPPFPAPPFSDTTAPGIYRVIQRDAGGHETPSLFAANFVSAGESRLIVADPPPAVLSTGAGTSAGSTTPAAPRELWQWLAVAAIVILAAEWLAYHRQ